MILPKLAWRNVWVGLIVVVNSLTSTMLLLHHWQFWLGVWLLTAYRIINLLRTVENRSPESMLKRLVPRSASWLIGLQIISLAIGYGIGLLSANTAWLGASIIQLILAAIILHSTYHNWRRSELLLKTKSRSDADLPTLSVLIPARNETDDLKACLVSLVASDYPKLEIIALDECSVTKRTPEIIRQFAHDGVRFVAGDEPDQTNWLAKNQAYQKLTNEASGELLLFCGVDVRFERQTLRLLVETMLDKKKQMLSVLPMHDTLAQAKLALIQPLRYMWELSLPRRPFNRPPVLSTCWIIQKDMMRKLGGFKAVARKVVPMAYFARQLAPLDGYSFVRSNLGLGLTSNKPARAQYDTAIRVRYPQLHRRVEIVVLTALAEFFIFFGPLIGLINAWFLDDAWLVAVISLLAVVCLMSAYHHVAARTKLNSPVLAWLLYWPAITVDLALIHISMWRYEFSTVIWKDRNVCIPVMYNNSSLPKS